jgi:hypothetical protein
MRTSLGRVALACSLAGVALASTANATTALDIRYSSDITVDFDAVPNDILGDEDVATDDLAGNVSELSVGTYPDGADLSAYHFVGANAQWIALDTTVALPGLPAPGIATPGDVVVYDFGGNTYSYLFQASAAGLPAGVAVDAVAADQLGRPLLSFDVSVDIDPTAAVVVADDEDVVRWNGGTSFTLVLDASAAGISGALDADALHFLPATRNYLISFDTSGTVGPVTFDDEDVLEYDPEGATWTLLYDGDAPVTGQAWAGADLDALDVVADSDDDTFGDAADNCASVANLSQADTEPVGNGGPDGVGDACDICTTFANPRVSVATLVANPWMTVRGMQRDGDADGRGDRCDFNYDNVGPVILAGDFNQAKASVGETVNSSTCGLAPTNNQPCQEFDHTESGPVILATDFNLSKAAVGKTEATAFPNCGPACANTAIVPCDGPAC